MTGARPDPAPASTGTLAFAQLRLIAKALRHPCAILLFVQLLELVFYPFIENRRGGNTAFGAFGILVLATAVRMVGRTSGRWWLAAGLALLAVTLGALSDLGGLSFLLPWWAACKAAFYFYAAYALVGYMLADRRATTDELYAAGATFTLLAWAFAYVFMVCQFVLPHSFGAAVDAAAPRSWGS